MGSAEIKDAFNAVAQPNMQAAVALIWLERDDAGKEWQVMLFRGTKASGEAFEAKTDRHDPAVDPVALARTIAKQLTEEA